ncbi:phosphatase PAP2 family protein [Hoylesella enoeca]|uniref:phosphatase PAP2 family protein n=1 Tax=Hoylesella enoeca TaxID=76123 RepID=UPI00288BB642|nr:phosphatase PAP2 family protein [Hoylesella enoeca]
MFRFFKELLTIDRSPRRGLLALEWAMLIYMLFTFVVIFFTYTKLHNPDAMIWGRVRIAAMTAMLWGAYRLLPCRLTLIARVAAQLALLTWWYPDTYELNRILPNQDHLFAAWEQQLFGFQPAYEFCKAVPSRVFSELMAMSYASYYPLIALTAGYYAVRRYDEFERASFVIMGSFFLYYVIFVLIPVTGPQYYYGAIGLDRVAHGIFPNVHDYFNTHQARLSCPGYSDGFFYHLVESAHQAGERSTAAFPSSHVGITLILLLLAWHSRSKGLFFTVLPLFILMCFATVYIRAHYVIDVVAGLITGTAFYFALQKR